MNGTISIEGLRKRYGELDALGGVDLEVPGGQMFAYLGPNGAGKSTTIRILTGLTKKSSGKARLGGFDIETQSLSAKLQFGVVHQYVNLDQELTVAENLDIHGQLFNMAKKERRSRAHELLGYVEMQDRANTLVKSLSGGLKRRVTIARALMHEPKILFLDEPTVGLDPAIRRRIWGLIKKIQQQGTTIFLTTHHIEEAEFLAERVALLDRGKIVALDSPENLIAKVGEWAIEELDGDTMKTHYFATREEAGLFQSTEGFTLRRVNLEDAFLALTGKKVSEATPNPAISAGAGHGHSGHHTKNEEKTSTHGEHKHGVTGHGGHGHGGHTGSAHH